MVVHSARRRAPTGTKRLRGTERRQQMIDAARRVVLDGGVPGVTMDRIATEAGVSKALMYQHFGNVSDVLLALLGEELARVDTMVDASAADESFDARVRAAARVFLEALDKRTSALHQLITQAAAEPQLEQAVLAYQARTAAAWSERAVAAFDLAARDADILGSMLLAAYEGIARYWIRIGCDVDVAVDVFTEGVLGACERVAAGPRR